MRPISFYSNPPEQELVHPAHVTQSSIDSVEFDVARNRDLFREHHNSSSLVYVLRSETTLLNDTRDPAILFW